MTLAQRRATLASLPLFAGLSEDALTDAAEAFDELTFEKGRPVVREGETGSDLIVVVSGELEVWTGDPARLIARLGPGELVGEVAALLGAGRTATVTAGRRSRVLRLPQREFERVIGSEPSALAYLSRILAQRLTSQIRQRSTPRADRRIAVVATPGLRGKTLIAASIAALIHQLADRPTVLVRVSADRPSRSSSPSEIALDRIQPSGGGPDTLDLPIGRGSDPAIELGHVLDALEARYRTIVIDGAGAPTEALTEVSDVLVRIVDEIPVACPSAGGTRILHVLNAWNASTPLWPVSTLDPIVIPADVDLTGMGINDIVKHVLLYPRARIARPLHRLARAIVGSTVGIALGGGAALGIGHVGVLRALEEAGIPIDAIAGTSFGSIVAIGYGAGLSAEEMVVIAERIGTVRTTLSALDVAVAKPGLLSGDRLRKIFAPFIPRVHAFDDLVVPTTLVAADVRTGERVLLDDGDVIAAVRASCSMPMVFVPVRWGGRTLVDGAMIDPVPVDVVSRMGADITIGVDVIPRPGTPEPSLLSRALDLATALNPLAHLNGTAGMPNAFDVMMNSINMLQYELSTYKASGGDATIRVDAGNVSWHQFHRARELVERGVRAGEAMVPEIERLIASRLAQ